MMKFALTPGRTFRGSGRGACRHIRAYIRVDPIEKLEILAARLPPSIVKGSFSGATDRLLAVLADARSA